MSVQYLIEPQALQSTFLGYRLFFFEFICMHKGSLYSGLTVIQEEPKKVLFLSDVKFKLGAICVKLERINYIHFGIILPIFRKLFGHVFYSSYLESVKMFILINIVLL